MLINGQERIVEIELNKKDSIFNVFYSKINLLEKENKILKRNKNFWRKIKRKKSEKRKLEEIKTLIKAEKEKISLDNVDSKIIKEDNSCQN